MPTIDAERLTDFAQAIFEGAGISREESRIVAEHLVLSNLYGVDSHGVIRISEYLQLIDEGRMKPGARPEIVKETKATANVDAHFGFGQVAGKMSMELAIKKAREYGTGTVTVFNSSHSGRIGAYPVLAAQQNMIGLFFVKGNGGDVSPWGGRKALLGTSPLSFAIPTGGGEPILADFATSISSEGKIRVMQSKGMRIPLGWILDAAGRPTQDPDELYSKGGTIVPFGAHKGYAMNLLLEALGGALSGGGISDELASSNAIFAQAIDIEFFTPIAEFKAKIDRLVERLRSSPPGEGFDEVLVPGDPEYREMKKRKANGISINDRIWNGIIEVARKYHITPPAI